MNEFDLPKGITEGKELSKITAGDIMTKEAISVTPEYSRYGDHWSYCRGNISSGAVVDAEGKRFASSSRRDI